MLSQALAIALLHNLNALLIKVMPGNQRLGMLVLVNHYTVLYYRPI